MAGPRSKWPSVALPEAPSPTLTVSVVRAVFAGALFEARVADSASVASRVTRVATQRSPVGVVVVRAPEVPAVLPAPPVLPDPPVLPVPEVWAGPVVVGAAGAGAGRAEPGAALSPGWPAPCPEPPCWAVSFPGPTPGAGASLAPGAAEASARHEASSATSIV